MRSEDSFPEIGISIILVSSDFDGVETEVSMFIRRQIYIYN